MKGTKKRTGSKVPVIVGVFILLAAAAAFVAWFFLRVKIIKEVILEAGDAITLESFFADGVPDQTCFLTDVTQIDTGHTGTYSIELAVKDKTYNATLQIVDTVAPYATAAEDLQAWAGVLPEAADCVTDVTDETDVGISWKKEPNVKQAGDVTGTVLLVDEGENTYQVDVDIHVIEDYQAPVIEGAEDRALAKNQEIDLTSLITVTDNLDDNPTVTAETDLDFSKEGTYQVTYVAVDGAGNETRESCAIEVKKDTEPPVVQAMNFSVEVGGSVSYKSHVTYFDELDPDPELTIDNQTVDLDTIGDYEVVYTVTDSSGNQASSTAVLHVVESVVTEEEVSALSAEVLAEITTDDMTQMQKAYAIYRWVGGHIGYVDTSEKQDWVTSAYDGLTRRTGDCYTYFAVAKALLTEAGIDNMDVVKVKRYATSSNHYWNLINVGTGWYHMDCTPFHDVEHNLFMVTDEEIWAWDTARGWAEHNFDESLLPDRATESVQDQINYSSGTLK
ncbi:MAG: transglutaminase domain-containing protein [Roseburia sp.]